MQTICCENLDAMNAIAAFRRLLEHPGEWLAPLAIFAIVFAAGWLARRFLLRALRAWGSRAESLSIGILAESLRGPSLIWALILGMRLAVQASDLPEKQADLAARALGILLILSLTLMGMRLARELVRHYGGKMGGAAPAATLTQNLAQAAVLILGILVLFGDNLGRITPILTTLGLGGLAVALALQDTLSNLFAGFHVAVAGYIRLGDYVKLGSGEEGYVSDIGWRCTTLRAMANNLIIVPNSKLGQAIVTNFHLPEKRMAASFKVSVSSDADPDRIERLLMDAAEEGLREIPGMTPEPAPTAAFDPGFGECGLEFTLNFQVEEFGRQSAVRNELRKRVLRKLRENGIAITFPMRAASPTKSRD